MTYPRTGRLNKVANSIKELYTEITDIKKLLKRKKRKKDSSGKRDPKKKRGKGKQKDDLPKNWKTTKPAAKDLKKPKTVDGKTWWWCSPETGGKCPGAWRTTHKPQDCNPEHWKKNAKKLKVKKALECIATDTDSDEESDA
jgi:hypothetical protein